MAFCFGVRYMNALARRGLLTMVKVHAPSVVTHLTMHKSGPDEDAELACVKWSDSEGPAAAWARDIAKAINQSVVLSQEPYDADRVSRTSSRRRDVSTCSERSIGFSRIISACIIAGMLLSSRRIHVHAVLQQLVESPHQSANSSAIPQTGVV